MTGYCRTVPGGLAEKRKGEWKIDRVRLVMLVREAKHPRGTVHVRKNGAFTCLRILWAGGSKLVARATDVASELRWKAFVFRIGRKNDKKIDHLQPVIHSGEGNTPKEYAFQSVGTDCSRV